MALTVIDMRRLLQTLVPPGLALPIDRSGSNLDSLLSGIGSRLLDAQQRFEALLVQADPRFADEMLPDWEALLGLPDECMASQDLGIVERRLVAYQRLIEQGGQSRAYFIGLSALLGEPGCTITEFRPTHCNDDCNDALYSSADRFAWRVNIPRPATNVHVAHCNDNCNDALQSYTASLIECPINERKPAHTTVLFAYAP